MQCIVNTYKIAPEAGLARNWRAKPQGILLIKQTSLKLFRIFNGLLGNGNIYYFLHIGYIMKGKAF